MWFFPVSRPNLVMRAVLFSILLAPVGVAGAQSFYSIDPRTLGMGGAGVASGGSVNAGLTNPALLSVVSGGEQLSVAAPIIGARFRDPDELADALDVYQASGREEGLTDVVATYKDIQAPLVEIVSPSQAITGAQNAAANVGSAAQSLLTQLQRLPPASLQGEALSGFAIAMPAKDMGASLNLSEYTVMNGAFDFTDQAFLQSIIDAADTTANADTQAELDALENVPAVNQQLTESGATVDSLTSNYAASGAVISELGLSLSREFFIAGHSIAFGVTPKVVQVKTFHYVVGVAEADINAEKGTNDFNDLNLDIGVAKAFDGGWKVGLSAKNLIAQEYETKPFVATDLVAQSVSEAPTKIKVEPQVRLGVSHRGRWLTVALDVDVTENEPAGIDSKSQYLGLGAEVELIEWARLRAGYRHNLSDSDTSIPTLGFGFSPFGLYLDVAYAQNDDEKIGSLQLGFSF